MGWFGSDVGAIWYFGTPNVVGILLGHYGTCYIFRYLWHGNGHVCLLLCNKNGKDTPDAKLHGYNWSCGCKIYFQEYNIPEVKDRHYLLTLYKRAKKRNFDVETYNSLRRQIAEIEYDLRRLRDPLNLQLPPHVDRSQEKPPLNPGQHAAITAKSTDISSSNVVKKSGFKIPFLDSKN